MTTVKTSGSARASASSAAPADVQKVARKATARGAADAVANAKPNPANGVAKSGVPRDAGAAPVPPAARTRTAAAVEATKPKQKLVRDSFTIPKSEYAVLDALKLRAARLMRPTKKSEVLRAGIAALDAMDDKAFLGVINGVPSLKTGRPKSTPSAAKASAK